MRFYILFVFCSLLFVACDNGNYLYQETKSINKSGWTHSDSLDFNFEIKDTSIVYSLILDVNHTTDYPYQNTYFNISTAFPSGRNLKQQLSSDLANKGGVWYGDCSGKNCTASINLQEKAKFDEVGDYKINIAQYSRDSSLLGINSLSLKLKEYINSPK